MKINKNINPYTSKKSPFLSGECRFSYTKEIEKRYIDSNENIFNMKQDLENTILREKNLEDINQKYEMITTNQQKRIEFLENQLKVVLTLIKDLFNKENNSLYPMRNKLFYDISTLNNVYQ